MHLSDEEAKRLGAGLLAVGAITALVPQILLPFTVYYVVSRLFSFALFPAASAIAFTLTLVAFLLFRRAHLPLDLAVVVVALLAVNLAVSALFLLPAQVLDAGCPDSSPRPCGFGPSLCAANLLTGVVSVITAWRAIREVRRFPPLDPSRI
jgi:hypothetical protein